MNPKSKKLITLLVEDTGISGPSPDAELLSVGQDMFWLPEGHQDKKKVSEEDPLLNIL